MYHFEDFKNSGEVRKNQREIKTKKLSNKNFRRTQIYLWKWENRKQFDRTSASMIDIEKDGNIVCYNSNFKLKWTPKIKKRS